MSALPVAESRHLTVVHGDRPAPAFPSEPAAPLVGYLVLVPEGADPAQLLAAQGVHAEVRPLARPGEPAARAAAPTAASVADAVAGSDAGPPGGIRVDRVRHTAEVEGGELELTYLEFELLAHFLAYPHRVHTRDQLVSTLWGYSHVGDGRTVDVHVARLRRKLGPGHRERIVTVRRVGYKYVPGPS